MSRGRLHGFRSNWNFTANYWLSAGAARDIADTRIFDLNATSSANLWVRLTVRDSNSRRPLAPVSCRRTDESPDRNTSTILVKWGAVPSKTVKVWLSG